MSQDRDLRELVERLQTELAQARAAQHSGEAEIARLRKNVDEAQERSGQVALELDEARKAARDADAAFEHVMKRLTEAKLTAQPPEEIRTTALANQGVRPDRVELAIRFVAGAMFGGFAGTIAARLLELRFDVGSFGALAVAGLSALTCGLLARHYGDRFWLRKS